MLYMSTLLLTILLHFWKWEFWNMKNKELLQRNSKVASITELLTLTTYNHFDQEASKYGENCHIRKWIKDHFPHDMPVWHYHYNQRHFSTNRNPSLIVTGIDDVKTCILCIPYGVLLLFFRFKLLSGQ